MPIYKEHESKPVKLHERPILATPEDLSVELGTIVAFIKKTQGVIEKAEASRLAGRARFDNLKLVLDRYEKAGTIRNRKEK